MIIPCMNSTSAGDRGGSFPVVDAGSFLLGFPGAPGCTITGGAESVCARRAGQKNAVRELKAKNKRADARADWCLQREGFSQRLGILLTIYGWVEKLVTKY